MTTMNLNGVQVYNIPTEVTEEVIAELTIIVSFAKLYSLSEFNYEQRFVTRSTVIEGECPHCEGTKEIGIDLLQTNEIAIVPCVCHDDHVGYNLSDTVTARPTAQPVQEVAEELHDTVTTVELLAPNIETLPETIGATLIQQATNQVAMMKLMGYNLSDVAQGLPTQAYQFLVIGQHDPETFVHALTTIPQFAGQGLKVIPMAVGVTPDMTEQEIKVPRVYTMEQLVAIRTTKDLNSIQDIAGVISTVTENMTGIELSANHIIQNMGNYTIDVNVFKSFVRTLVTQAKLKNARYDIINPQNRSRIATAYYHHTESNEYFMCTLDFEAGAQQPTDYMITRVPQPTEITVNTADMVQGIATHLNDIRVFLEGGEWAQHS